MNFDNGMLHCAGKSYHHAEVWRVKELVDGSREPRDKIERKFLKYHQENPHVYQSFDRLAQQAILTGRKKCSAWHIVNGMRWETFLTTNDPNSDFMISNDYISLYARYWMEMNPDHLDFFDTKLRQVELKEVIQRGMHFELGES